MQDCPTPVLGTTLAEINRVLSFILEPDQFETYQNALSTLTAREYGPFRDVVDSVHNHFVSQAAKDDFASLLLSQRAPLFQTLLMTITLSSPTHLRDQLGATSELLARLAVICVDRHRYLSKTPEGAQLDEGQAEGILSTTRLPGKEIDTLVSSPESRHVIIWVNGQAFALDILDASRRPKSVQAMEKSLSQLVEFSRVLEYPEYSVASLSWNLSRPQWLEMRLLIQAQAENAKSLAILESALTTIALEPFALQSKAEILENVRSGKGSVSRYADHTLSFVVYQDGSAGFSADHAPVDGGISMQLANALASCKPAASPETRDDPADFHHLPFTLPCSLTSTPKDFQDAAHVVRIASLGSSIPMHIMHKIKHHRLVHFIIHMAVQSALQAVKGVLLSKPLIVQPVSARHFAHGRAHPSYPVTSDSISLIDALHGSAIDLSHQDRRQELCALFGKALVTHKKLVKAVKLGTSVGPHHAALSMTLARDERARSIPEAQVVLEAWSRFSGMNGPIVSVTGFTDADGAEDAMGNIYGPDQLMGWYTGHTNTSEISLSLNGCGIFAAPDVVDRITTGINHAYDALIQVAVDYLD